MYGNDYVEYDYNMDDVANFDIPVAVDTIKNERSESDVHIIGNCLGSMGAAMALANRKITGIRSFICASIGLYPDLGPLASTKLYLVPSICRELMGLTKLSPDPASMGFSIT